MNVVAELRAQQERQMLPRGNSTYLSDLSQRAADEIERLRSIIDDLTIGARRDRSVIISSLGPLHVIETRVTKGQVLRAMKAISKEGP